MFFVSHGCRGNSRLVRGRMLILRRALAGDRQNRELVRRAGLASGPGL